MALDRTPVERDQRFQLTFRCQWHWSLWRQPLEIPILRSPTSELLASYRYEYFR